MSQLNRRDFIKIGATLPLLATAKSYAASPSSAKIVVIGGDMAVPLPQNILKSSIHRSMSCLLRRRPLIAPAH